MNIRSIQKASAIVALVLGSGLSGLAWAAPAEETVTVRAAEKAAHYRELATFYRSLARPESKHLITYFTAANRADRLAQRYQRLATAEENHRG